MSYKKELEYIKNNSFLKDIELEKEVKITDEEIKDFEHYSELRNEIMEHKEKIKNIVEQDIITREEIERNFTKEEIEKQFPEYKMRTEEEKKQDFRYLDSFAEIDRLEAELAEMIINNNKFNFNYQYENLYKIPENIFEVEDFKKKIESQDLDIEKLKEINQMLSNSNNPKNMLSKILLMNNEAQIEAIYSYSRNENLVESFLSNKKAELEEELKKPLSIIIEEEKSKKRKGLKR